MPCSLPKPASSLIRTTTLSKRGWQICGTRTNGFRENETRSIAPRAHLILLTTFYCHSSWGRVRLVVDHFWRRGFSRAIEVRLHQNSEETENADCMLSIPSDSIAQNAKALVERL